MGPSITVSTAMYEQRDARNVRPTALPQLPNKTSTGHHKHTMRHSPIAGPGPCMAARVLLRQMVAIDKGWMCQGLSGVHNPASASQRTDDGLVAVSLPRYWWVVEAYHMASVPKLQTCQNTLQMYQGPHSPLTCNRHCSTHAPFAKVVYMRACKAACPSCLQHLLICSLLPHNVCSSACASFRMKGMLTAASCSRYKAILS